ncbi:MAG: Biopolymer transport protein ExbB [Verrucomicrobia bacterium ADurb.Bin345]|nr:MAG: Biopolymer transport protein ExbB [Verrucomicrobia bacterium ADurb.Bin345]
MAKKIMLALMGAWLVCGGLGMVAWAQDEAAPAEAAPAEAAPPGMELATDAQPATTAKPAGLGFFEVIRSSGFLGIILWMALGVTSLAAGALAIDSFVTIRTKKIMPEGLVQDVRSAMEQGDVMKALKICDEQPGPFASILSAGFANVREGYDVIQDVVGVAADLESEKLMQRVAYLNVCANLAPMLGLLGTVQGMIYAFATLATTQAGAAQQSMLALNIAQALWTTAAGLCVAIPAVGFYTFFKNRATKIILGMEALTMDLIKSLRNVEVVEE